MPTLLACLSLGGEDDSIGRAGDGSHRLPVIVDRSDRAPAEQRAARAFAAETPGAPDPAQAFVVLRPEAGHLCAAVDALGRHELYWAKTTRSVWLADDPAPLLSLPGVGRALDEVALANHLVGYPWDERRTPFAAIRRLPPGHRLDAYTHGEVSLRRWWDPRPEKVGRLLDGEAPEDLARRWRAALAHSIDDHLPSLASRDPSSSRKEPPDLGILLSGGLDSAALAGLARARRPRARLVAGSHVFPTLHACDERPWIQAIAETCNMHQVHVNAEAHPLLDEPAAYAPSLSEPFCAWSTADRSLMGALAESGVATLWSGHGGDLVIGGSTLALAARIRGGDPRALSAAWRDEERRARGTSTVRWLWDQGIAPLVSAGAAGGLGARLGRRSTRPEEPPPWIAPGLAARTDLLAGRPARPPAPQAYDDPARQALYGALRHPGAVNRAVRWLDRMARPFGLEMRHPYLDRQLAELALRLPPRATYDAGRRKGVHRAALRGCVPARVLERRGKTDLSAYHDHSLRQPRAVALVRHLFSSPLGADLDLVNPHGLRQLHARFLAGHGGVVGDALWSAVSLELWLRRHASHLDLR